MAGIEQNQAGCAVISIIFRWNPPHPALGTIRDNVDHMTVLLYSYYTTITGQGVLPNHPIDGSGFRIRANYGNRIPVLEIVEVTHVSHSQGYP